MALHHPEVWMPEFSKRVPDEVVSYLYNLPHRASKAGCFFAQWCGVKGTPEESRPGRILFYSLSIGGAFLVLQIVLYRIYVFFRDLSLFFPLRDSKKE